MKILLPQTVDDSSELQSAAPDDSTSSDDFSSDDDEAVFSSGSESPNSENIDYILGRPMTDEERQAQLAPLQNLDAFAPEPEVDSNIGIASYALYPGTYNANEERFVTEVKIREIPASAGLSASHPTLRLLCLPGNRSTTIFPKNNWLISGQIE